MEHNFEFDNDADICTVYITGTFTRPGDAVEIEHVVINLHNVLGCGRFLIDMTNAHIVSTTIDTFEAGNPPAEISKILRALRVAVLYSELTEDHRFLETVAVNRGFTLYVFDENDKAVKWLTH